MTNILKTVFSGVDCDRRYGVGAVALAVTLTLCGLSSRAQSQDLKVGVSQTEPNKIAFGTVGFGSLEFGAGKSPAGKSGTEKSGSVKFDTEKSGSVKFDTEKSDAVKSGTLGSSSVLKGSVKSVADAVWKQVGADEIRLESGLLLLHPAAALRVSTAHGSVIVQKNCAVLVSAEPKISHFLVLFDTWSRGVTVITDKHSRKVVSGSEMAVVQVATSDEALQELVQDGLRRRHVKVVEDTSNQFIATDQFSIPDAILKQSVLSALARSSEKSDRSMYEHLVKVAAAISVTGSPEPYTTHE
ncbi:MAG: hypothetical protein JST89_25875 [Cyanobacteria bacterium SZAS-4]|nr:hypothetical protein [Cyanobacteria bacterium SZAS-4]